MSCERFEGSPFEVSESEPRYNDVNIARIEALPKKDTIVFAFIGDTQRFYDDVRDAVNAINKEHIDFTIISGDITDFGLKQEYDLMIDILNDLEKPFVASIGNHDMVAQGRKNFKRYFGDEHVSFQASKFKFVLHNTNSVAMGFDRTLPDIAWLRQLFEATPSNVQLISLSHVPPFNVDFDPALSEPYHHLLNNTPNHLLSLHGHLHTQREWQHGNVHYANSSSPSKRTYMVIQVAGDWFEINHKSF